MNVREADLTDRPAIRDVARRSLQASYSLGTAEIVGAIEEWYAEDRLVKMVDDDRKLLLMAVRDGQQIAFSHSSITSEETGELYWIHVDPEYRSADVGEVLFRQTRERLGERGAEHLHGRVLDENVGGNEFYRRHGLVKVGDEEVTIAGDTYVENVYAEPSESGPDPLELDGRTVYVDRTTQETGSIAPFHVIYAGEDCDEIFGYWCANCEETANAMDPMGRIQCDSCGNARKPTRWDAAYL